MNRKLTLVAVLAFLAFPTIGGTTESAQTLNLDETLALALANNPGLRGQAAAVEAGRWASRSSNLAYLPTGSFSSSMTRVDDNSLDQANQSQIGLIAMIQGLSEMGASGLDGIAIDPFLYRDTYRSSFSMNQEFPLNLHLIGGSKLARAGLRARRENHAAGRAALKREVRQAYFRLLAAGELLTVAEEALGGAENRQQLAIEREELGMINRADRMLWDVTVAEARADQAVLRTGLALAEMDLNRLMGRALQAPLTPVPVDAKQLASARELASRELPELSDRALGNGPLARALAAGEDAAAAGKLLAFSGLVPSLHFSFSYGWRENDTMALDDYSSWSATALINVPVFDLASRWSGYRESAADERRRRHESDDARASLRLGVASAWYAVHRSEQVLVHRQAAADQADETFALMRDRHDLGHISEFDLIDVQTARSGARAMAVQARYDHYGALAALESLLDDGTSASNGKE